MKRYRLTSVVLIICMLCCLTVIDASANTLEMGKDKSFDIQSEKVYYDVDDIPDNIRTLIDKHGTVNEDFKILKTESSKNGQIDAGDIYSLKLEREDDSGIAEVFSTPIKFIDEHKEKQFIDTSLVSSDRISSAEGYEYRNAANSFTVEFSVLANKGLRVNNAFTLAIFNNESAIDKKGFVDKSETGAGKFIYEDGFGPGTTVEYINTEIGVKENIILEKNICKNTFDFIFNSKTHIPILSEEKTSINIVDKNDYDKIDYSFSNLFVYDSFKSEKQNFENNGSSFRHLNQNCYYELTRNSNDEYIITVVVPKEYLNNPNVVYPVIIDPTISVNSISSNIADAFISQSSPNSNFSSYEYLRFGNTSSSGGRNYFFVWFRNLPSIPSSYVISKASLNLTFLPGQTTSSTGAAYRVTGHWAEATITWNNRPAFESTPMDTSSHNNCSYYEFDILPTINARYQGLTSNEGVLISYSDLAYNDYNSVYSSEAAANGPKLTIYYYTPEVVIPNGVYFIGNMGNYNGYYMDVAGNGITNGTHIQQYQFGGYKSEQWQIIYQGWGYYKIRTMLTTDTTMLLDGRNPCVTGAQVILYQQTPCPEQLWKIEPTGDDGKSYVISPMRNSKLYLTVENPQNGNNAKVKLESRTTNERQVWTLEPSGAYRYVPISSASAINSGQYQNCLGYVTFNDSNIGRLNSTLDSSLEIHLNRVAEQIKTIPGISSCRRIASYDSPIALNEYRIAYRTVSHTSNQGFHFIMQLSNGAWAGKNDYMQSQYFSTGNPSTSSEMWIYDLYPPTHGTHYFAISRN